MDLREAILLIDSGTPFTKLWKASTQGEEIRSVKKENEKVHNTNVSGPRFFSCYKPPVDLSASATSSTFKWQQVLKAMPPMHRTEKIEVVGKDSVPSLPLSEVSSSTSNTLEYLRNHVTPSSRKKRQKEGKQDKNNESLF